MGRWKLPNIIAVTVVPLGALLLYWLPSSAPEPFAVTLLGPQRVGPWVAVVGTPDPIPPAPGATIQWQVRFCPGCYEEMRRAALGYGDAAGPRSEPQRISGNPNKLQVLLAVPKSSHGPVYLWLECEEWSGVTHRLSWPLPGEQATGSPRRAS